MIQNHAACMNFLSFPLLETLYTCKASCWLVLSLGWNVMPYCFFSPLLQFIKNQRSWTCCFHMAFLVYWLYLLVKICFQLHIKNLMQTTLGKSRCIVFLAHITSVLFYQELKVQWTDVKWSVMEQGLRKKVRIILSYK